MGSVVIPIRELLSEPELVLDQWFHLDGASPESQILLRTELKVCQSLSLSVFQFNFFLFVCFVFLLSSKLSIVVV